MKRSPLKRTASLSPRGKGGACPPKPSGAERNGIGTPKRAKDAYDGFEWRASVWIDHEDRVPEETGWLMCEACIEKGDSAWAEQAHHVIPKRQLYDRLAAAVAAVAVMDPRNGMPLCEDCHAAHHARSAPIPRSVLRQAAFDFAKEHNLTWLLEKTYPGVQA